MRKKIFVILFFTEGVWLRIRNKKPALVSTGINLLEEGEVKLTPKPSQADAMANKAKFGINQVPKEHRGKAIAGIVTTIFFMIFGIVDFIRLSVLLINAYPIIGWILLSALLAFILYRISKSIYWYFVDRRHMKISSLIKTIWNEAKIKAELKFQN